MQENRNIKKKFEFLFAFNDYVVIDDHIFFFINIAYFNLRTWITFDLKIFQDFFYKLDILCNTWFK